jgi:hypothetical protein
MADGFATAVIIIVIMILLICYIYVCAIALYNYYVFLTKPSGTLYGHQELNTPAVTSTTVDYFAMVAAPVATAVLVYLANKKD